MFGLLLCCAGARAQSLYHEDFRIAAPGSGPRGLEALLVRPQGGGKYPLALINHGSPRDADNRKTMSTRTWLPIANEFARRGFAAVVVMRRGYGTSGGEYAESSGRCDNRDYLRAARVSAGDLKASIESLRQRDDIDVSRTIAVGLSAGGLAAVALTAQAPPGLMAAINFAGGRGSDRPDEVCQEDRLIAAFHALGKTSRTPMLWVYSANDHYFGPALAEKFRAAFVAAGGQVEFIAYPPFGEDGHRLFSLNGIPQWTPLVDAFFAKHGLQPRQRPIALDVPALKAPIQLSERGRKSFELYLLGAPHKAFAVTPSGHFGWRTGRQNIEEAVSGALKLCNQNDCSVVFIDDHAAP
jgi:dienelactone hydrolase